MKATINQLTPLRLTVGLAALAAAASTAHGEDREYVETLKPSTGFNSDCNQPIFALPAPLPPDIHFDFIGLHNPATAPGDAGNDASPLTQDSCVKALDQAVATTTNPDFRAANGFPDVDERLKNRRSNEVPMPTLLDGARIAAPPEGALGAPFPTTHSIPADAMTLGEFRDVRGFMRVTCRDDGTGAVEIRVFGYRPNALVTVWAIWYATPPGAPGASIVPLPFGGVPNMLAINNRGNGVFSRELGYCPMDVTENGDQLLLVDLAEHWDGSTYGALPDQPLTEYDFLLDPTDPESAFRSYIGGTVTMNRGVFRMTAE
ncbi:MAG: hypothetical protein AAGA68_15440 [Pseudomonadota bacterium]